MPKKEWGSPDAQTIVIYGKRTDDTSICYPVFVNAHGSLQVSDQSGMSVPYHDTQVITETPTLTTIVFSLSGSTVATKTILVVGSTTTITLT
jgi:hypothetical protein